MRQTSDHDFEAIDKKARRFFRWRAGVRKKIKNKYNRKMRRETSWA